MLTLDLVGKRIKDLRENKSISQLQLVDTLTQYGLNMSRETLSKIETGSRSISVVEIKAISSVLGTDTEELLKDDEDESLITLFRRANTSGEVISEIEQLQEMIKSFIYQKGINVDSITVNKREPIWKQ